MADVGEDLGGAAFVRVEDYADAKLIGGAFKADGEHAGELAGEI